MDMGTGCYFFYNSLTPFKRRGESNLCEELLPLNPQGFVGRGPAFVDMHVIRKPSDPQRVGGVPSARSGVHKILESHRAPQVLVFKLGLARHV